MLVGGSEKKVRPCRTTSSTSGAWLPWSVWRPTRPKGQGQATRRKCWKGFVRREPANRRTFMRCGIQKEASVFLEAMAQKMWCRFVPKQVLKATKRVPGFGGQRACAPVRLRCAATRVPAGHGNRAATERGPGGCGCGH